VTPEEAQELAASVRRVCPEQQINDLAVARWPVLLAGLRLSECLVAVGLLGCFKREIQPAEIRGAVEGMRRNQVEPGGAAYENNLASHGGREFEGGPVCWDPRTSCEGVCRVCPRGEKAAAS
jgi:hypothetical protein